MKNIYLIGAGGGLNFFLPQGFSTSKSGPENVSRPQRSRKCSIVREEEDDEEGGAAAGARAADARRGSRSEGRLHLARPAQLADNLVKVSATRLFIQPLASACDIVPVE